ncbi:MAG: S8 family serine peptidase [Coriobacteriia bacterium]
MTESPDTRTGWHVRRWTPSGESQGGPYTWEQLLEFARRKPFQPQDKVWHPSMTDWVSAQSVPGLGAAPVSPQVPVAPVTPQTVTPVQPAYAATAYAPQPAPTPPAPPRKKRGGLIALIVVLAVVLIGGGIGAWLIFGKGGNPLAGDDGPKMGEATAKVPDRASLVKTAEWGEVPANQICVMLTEGSNRKDAEKVAEVVGGTVVGEVEFVSLFQIEFAGATEADLVAALQTAEGVEGVDYAFPNQQVYSDAEIWGKRVDAYDDPIYGGGAGDGYKAMGVSKAWTYIRGAGVDLNNVKVGVVDDGLYMPGEGVENEFEGGKVNIEFPDPAAGENASPEVWDNGTTNPAGSHGTGVSTIIGANPDNGGPSGVAGPLGNKLTISMINHYTGQYGNTETAPDPNDPTKFVWSNGKTYVDGSLVALTKQVSNGAKVINCSWGNSEASTITVAAYNRFFTKMAAEHPDVLFVCSGGNGGKVMKGANRIPSGLKLPNMITVGALDNDGKTADYADKASDDYEITLGAPGTQQVVGTGTNGGPEKQDGSSFAAPQVTAAAAILKSLNPKLSAGDIKQILTATARPGVPNTSGDPNASSKLVNKGEMGAGIVALDEAVLKVINDLRVAKGLPVLTAEMLEQMGVVDAVAITGAQGEYTVKGIVKAAGEKGVDVKIEVFGENSGVGGKTEQSLTGAGEAKWGVTLPEDKGTIKVTRLDNGAASVITIESIDINGAWSGTFTVTNVTITDQEAAEKEGCSAAIMNAIKGKPLPMTLDVTVDESGQGSGVMLIDMSSLDEDGETTSEPQTIGISYSGSTVTFSPQGEGISSMTASVSRDGDTYVMNGTLSGGGSGWTMAAVFKLSKPAPTD